MDLREEDLQQETQNGENKVTKYVSKGHKLHPKCFVLRKRRRKFSFRLDLQYLLEINKKMQKREN